jgi:hypothetical protein
VIAKKNPAFAGFFLVVMGTTCGTKNASLRTVQRLICALMLVSVALPYGGSMPPSLPTLNFTDWL